MSIKGKQLKCIYAILEDTKNTQARVLCSVKNCGVPCRYVGWDQGQWMQTDEVRECPKFLATFGED